MRWLEIVASLVFLAFAGVQINDPDSLPWVLIYSGTAGVSLAFGLGRISPILLNFWLLTCLLPAIPLLGDLVGAPLSSYASFGMADLGAERARESAGLLLAASWTAFLRRRNAKESATTSRRAAILVLALPFLGGCALATPWSSAPPPIEAIQIPAEVPQKLSARSHVLRRLHNPRGTLLANDGTLLVAVAGTGTERSDGGILRFQLDAGGHPRSPATLLANQHSQNLLALVRRDEVFGVAAIKAGENEIRATAAYYEGPSRILTIDDSRVRTVGDVAGNLNDIVWHPGEKRWFAVSSSANELLRLSESGAPVTITSFPALEGGQEAVPGYLRHDPRTDELLVSLFSGSPLGEAGGDGTEIIHGAGKVVSVDPQTGTTRDLVTGLTAPTDLELSADGNTLWILELCDSFVGPVRNRREMADTTTHGGFRRFSGRLLQIDRTAGTVEEIARQLDTPTNLSSAGGWLLISTGMGTSGRQIPGPDRIDLPLEGRVEAVRVSSKSFAQKKSCSPTRILRRRFSQRSLLGR